MQTSVSTPNAPEYCTVCHARALTLLEVISEVPYWRCNDCEATMMDPHHWLSAAEEKAIYDLHDNNLDDPGYQRFLEKLMVPLVDRLPDEVHGLDFGCGPGPALAQMLCSEGMEVSLYDPVYQPATDVLERQFDFITCTEVAEHLHDPKATFEQLDGLLKPGGWLGVMTCFQTDDTRFANWHYRRDPTHVVFYREATLARIAQAMGWTLEIPAKDVALFQKPQKV
ncbi:MAG: 2-polyprenyl-3-methyl-5-hydroxy-6-metoxy-1,4-benzoquinol methylase [Alteromonadaceae bacterium]|nr:2-polyprenyl-3-methyl-5-hydroxy-6-metoxy-1,4-benzoquinol methylase [Alteromonadaceae bacterium]MBH84468.1 2-polyprenyl-3-methyl-5-hydroxy-6-metoxy-1,4-benzoquinol methylase [Alteromonadaceae bacterium]|tara:strand:- start:30598 stop:31272 length:675 start_codon:yes stop_codon:yes gene_type:complete